MSSRDVRAYLYDIVEVCTAIETMLAGCTLEDYRADLRTRWATERALISAGEALARLRDVAPDLAATMDVPVRQVVGLRNILVHGYFKLDDERVFEIASEQIPTLAAGAKRVLGGDSGA